MGPEPELEVAAGEEPVAEEGPAAEEGPVAEEQGPVDQADW